MPLRRAPGPGHYGQGMKLSWSDGAAGTIEGRAESGRRYTVYPGTGEVVCWTGEYEYRVVTGIELIFVLESYEVFNHGRAA